MHTEFFGSQIMAWQLFISLGILLSILEMVVPGFVLFPVGIAFIATGLTSLILTSWSMTLLSLVLYLLIVFFVFRKYILGKPQAHTQTNTEHMIGQIVKVIEDIDADKDTGYVKLYGDEWRALNPSGQSISKGQRVKILKVDGNKVIVERIEN